MSDLAPGFLLAVPQLADPNFSHAVVLLLEHTDNGALGLVVNRPGLVKLADVAKSQGLPVRGELQRQTIFIGGPVSPERGFLLHDRTDIEERVEVLPGLYVSSSTDSLQELFAGPVERYRLCLGYSGWDAGQLEKELREGSWLPASASATHVLTTEPADTWAAVLREMGIDPGAMGRGGGVH